MTPDQAEIEDMAEMDAESVDATIRTNEFTLEMSGLSNLKFDIQSHFITDGQPWEGISKIQCSDTGCTMYVEAGRKGSSETADWFKSAINPGSAIGCDTYDTLPEELNFAFKGTMTFDHGGKTYTGKDIVIAQGSTIVRNNWWIGGPHMSVLTNIPNVLAAAAQTVKTSGLLPAKATFTTSLGDVSSMQLGIIEI